VNELHASGLVNPLLPHNVLLFLRTGGPIVVCIVSVTLPVLPSSSEFFEDCVHFVCSFRVLWVFRFHGFPFALELIDEKPDFFLQTFLIKFQKIKGHFLLARSGSKTG
jgi:hypothetical protein